MSERFQNTAQQARSRLSKALLHGLRRHRGARHRQSARQTRLLRLALELLSQPNTKPCTQAVALMGEVRWQNPLLVAKVPV